MSEHGQVYSLLNHLRLPEEIPQVEQLLIEIFKKTNKKTRFPLHSPEDLLHQCDLCIELHNPAGDEIIGYMIINKYTDGKRTFLTDKDRLYNPAYIPVGYYIEQVYVLPEYQNRGFGTDMYNYLRAIVASDFVSSGKEIAVNLYTHVAVNNKQSLKFHCKQGFIPIGDYFCDDFYGCKNYHSVLMELDIRVR